MVNKGIVCAILLALLLALTTTVQIVLETTFSSFDNKINAVNDSINQYQEELDNPSTQKVYKDLEKYWDNSISLLCVMINYNQLSPIGEAIKRLKAGIDSNDYTSSLTETLLLKQIVQALQKIYSVRLANIF